LSTDVRIFTDRIAAAATAAAAKQAFSQLKD